MTPSTDYNWVLLLTTHGLPVLTAPDSKEPEAKKLKILANNLAMEYLKAPPADKLQFLEMYIQPLDQLIGQLHDLLGQFESEKEHIKKSLEAPCQTLETA